MNNENLIPAKAKDGGWTCDKCGLVFRTRLLLNTHKKEVHKNTKEDDYKKRSASKHQICSCSFCGRKFSTKSGKSIHEKYCADNPNHISCNGHKQSDKVKLKLSLFWKEKHKDYKCAFIVSFGDTTNQKTCYIGLDNISSHSSAVSSSGLISRWSVVQFHLGGLELRVRTAKSHNAV